jgi:hypothetical protein
VENFIYHQDSDSYTCPQGNTLTNNGSWYRARNYRFQQYKTRACKKCPVRSLCTAAKHNGKIIQRSEFTAHIEGNARRVAQNPETYKKRQALVEHPFGTIKRQWGFDHILTKRGMKAASADFGLIALAYNLRRLFNLSKPGNGLKPFLFHLSRLKGALCMPISRFIYQLARYWLKTGFRGKLVYHL